jgi:hypothetical protein
MEIQLTGAPCPLIDAEVYWPEMKIRREEGAQPDRHSSQLFSAESSPQMEVINPEHLRLDNEIRFFSFAKGRRGPNEGWLVKGEDQRGPKKKNNSSHIEQRLYACYSNSIMWSKIVWFDHWE